MPNHLTSEIGKRLMEMIESLGGELHPVGPAIRIENVTANGAGLDVERIAIRNRVVEEERHIEPNEELRFTKPATVYRSSTKEDYDDSGPLPDPIQIAGKPGPLPVFSVKHQIEGEVIRVTASEGGPPGSRTYIRLVNLSDERLHVWRTVPDDWPWGDEGSVDLTAPAHYQSDEAPPHGQLTTWITEPSNKSEKEQLILYYFWMPNPLYPREFVLRPVG
ncbi:MAG: hypothetical protein OES69_08755 [Myxococcales bacterium]|nr:hypothetical protein [Myxococcales bacterium]